NINQYSNIINIEWNNIQTIEKLDYGDSNYYLLVTFFNENKNIINKVLLKTSSTIAQEVYASVLENILKLPIPAMRLLDFSMDEYFDMSRNLLNCSTNDQGLNEFIKYEILDKSFILVMEYRENGKRFNELNHKEYFSGKKGEKKYRQLGRIMAFELFCNSFFRASPSNWDENTFFSNLIFYESPSKNGWYFSLINSNIICLSNSIFTSVYRDHINKIKLFLFSIFQNPNSESTQLKLMKDHLNKYLNIYLTSSSSVYIQKGIAKGIKSMVKSLSLPILEDTKEKLKGIVKMDNNNIWKKGIDSIYCPFLLDVLDEIALEYSTNYREKTYFVK
ncbi:hypothetical protein DICPUDRAFT_7275, partial [Dictyostelium purpureum]